MSRPKRARVEGLHDFENVRIFSDIATAMIFNNPDTLKNVSGRQMNSEEVSILLKIIVDQMEKNRELENQNTELSFLNQRWFKLIKDMTLLVNDVDNSQFHGNKESVELVGELNHGEEAKISV